MQKDELEHGTKVCQILKAFNFTKKHNYSCIIAKRQKLQKGNLKIYIGALLPNAKHCKYKG